MGENILYRRSVKFRDIDKNSWTVDFEIRKQECERRNRKTLEMFNENFEVSVCGSGGSCGGQCDNSIKPRSEGQEKLKEFWLKYHLNNMSGGTHSQTEYLHSELYISDYKKFVELFTGYDKYFRESFDLIDMSVLMNAFSILESAATVRTVIEKHMGKNPILYIIGLPGSRYANQSHNIDDLYVKFFFLAVRGLYEDRGYKYGNGWLYDPIPKNIQGQIDEICELIEEEEEALTEELEAVFDMGAENFVPDEKIVEKVMELRECDEAEACRFVALGMHLECTFGDLNDTFEDCTYGNQLYSANGIQYYLGTSDELENIASDIVHNDSEYKYFWKQSVEAGGTEDSLKNWLDSIISQDGFASVLNHYDGGYGEYKVCDNHICVCRC